MNLIEVRDLTKIYNGGRTAVSSISFDVSEGEIFGFLGPNGAGKSTTIKMMTTLLSITSGTITINGHNVIKKPHKVRECIGYIPQEMESDDLLTGWENLFLHSKFFGLSTKTAKKRIEEVLEVVNLTERASDTVKSYSGGMRKRLDIACGLVHSPQLLILDEPTLGLDIQTRREIWKYINNMRKEKGMTIFLTTHYMEEADQLCDRIAIIDQGEIKVIDAPQKLKAGIEGDIITLKFMAEDEGIINALEEIRNLNTVRNIKQQEDHYLIIAADGEATIPQIIEITSRMGVKVVNISLKMPSLDDIYVHITGHGLRDGNAFI